MKLTFLGATHEVTGSCTMVECCGIVGLVDCGMEQGKDCFENQSLPVSPAKLDYVLLTHAHIDHSGLLPLLTKNGFRGSIYATEETANLSAIMLMDCAHIQMQEAQWKARKAARAGLEAEPPIYDLTDAQDCLKRFRPCQMHQRFQIAEGTEVRFVNAGHLLGSASIELWLTENGVTRKVVFSGDLGNVDLPILRQKDYIEDADYAVIESTYGDRLHESCPDPARFLAECIRTTLGGGGNLVIPAFAVGRTQEMLYLLREIKQQKLAGMDFPVYVDSPLAIEATGVFLQCADGCLDEKTLELAKQGINPLMFPGLRLAVTSEESKAINADPTPKVILSASGMCEAGRIRHHLKHNLWRENAAVLFVGYQAAGTLGRSLLEGVKEVKLFNETVAVNARILSMPGKSGHADQAELLNWLAHFTEKPRHVFVNHGEDEACTVFAGLVQSRLGIHASAPFSGSEFDVAAGRYAYESVGIPVVRKTLSPAAARKNSVYAKLTAALARLAAIVEGFRGRSNKDTARFADQIQALCDKWQ